MKKKPTLWYPKKVPAENARLVLPGIAAEFFMAGRKAAEERSEEALHKFRLLVKRFRYTLEAFRPLYGPGLEQRIEKLRAIQQLLGALNDCATTRRLLENRPHDGSEELQEVLKLVESRMSLNARKFREYWTGSFDAAGEESKWLSYLARQAGRVNARAKAGD